MSAPSTAARKPAATPSKPAVTPSKTTAASKPAATTDDAGKDESTKKIEALDVKMKAINANNVARVANSQITSPDEKLYPLMSLKTGRPIEKFPETSATLPKMNLTLIDSILNALEAERTGKESEKRSRFRMQIGLNPNPA